MSDGDSRPRPAVWRPSVGDAAREVLGEQFGGVFVDDDQATWVVKAVAPTDSDHRAVVDAAKRLGMKLFPGRRRGSVVARTDGADGRSHGVPAIGPSLFLVRPGTGHSS